MTQEFRLTQTLNTALTIWYIFIVRYQMKYPGTCICIVFYEFQLYIAVDLIKLGEKCCRTILNLAIKVWLELRNIIRVVLGLKIILKALEHCCFTEYLYRNDFFFVLFSFSWRFIKVWHSSWWLMGFVC